MTDAKKKKENLSLHLHSPSELPKKTLEFPFPKKNSAPKFSLFDLPAKMKGDSKFCRREEGRPIQEQR